VAPSRKGKINKESTRRKGPLIRTSNFPFIERPPKYAKLYISKRKKKAIIKK
jgi:hypothetical protein